MVLTKEDIRIINELMSINIKKIYKDILSKPTLVNMTYDELTRDIVKISGKEYEREFKIERLE
ncbi:MAG: hypothetical protein AB9915_03640 [Candidatus Dojkabacteria bacterium]